MKKTIFLMSLFCLSYAHAEECYLDDDDCIERVWTVKARVAAFFPASDRFREVYGRAVASYQLEATTNLFSCYNGWANLDWTQKTGHSNHLGYYTTVKLLNFSFGLSLPIQFTDNLGGYIGLGPCIAGVYVHNRFTSEHNKETRSAFGGVLKSGLIYDFTECFFGELFLDYSYQRSSFRTRVNIGGTKLGLGLGLKF